MCRIKCSQAFPDSILSHFLEIVNYSSDLALIIFINQLLEFQSIIFHRFQFREGVGDDYFFGEKNVHEMAVNFTSPPSLPSVLPFSGKV